MALRKIGVFLSAVILASALVSVSQEQPASAKTSKVRRHSGRAYFVPPPPPYAPSILPESLARQSVSARAASDDVEVVKPPENPYAKYIFTRDAAKMPRVVAQANRT